MNIGENETGKQRLGNKRKLKYILLTEMYPNRFTDRDKTIIVFCDHVAALQEKFDFEHGIADTIGTEIHIRGIILPIKVKESTKVIIKMMENPLTCEPF